MPTPCSSTPAGTLSHGHGESRRGPRFWQQRRLTAGLAISGLNSTAWTLAVYASQWLLPAPTQDSLPATGQVYRVGLVTHRVATKGFRDAGYIPSSFPELLWTQAGSGRRLPVRPSHRSGLAQLRHPARQVTVWPALCYPATLRRHALRLSVLGVLPAAGSVSRRPLPSTGCRRSGSPASQVL